MADLTRLHWTQLLAPHREPCVVATTEDITTGFLNCPDEVDGVSLSVGDRILVWMQDDATENGFYQVDVVGGGANGEWSRTDDFDDDEKIETGISTRIQKGDTFAGKAFYLETQGALVVDTTELVFCEVPGDGENQKKFIFDSFNGSDDDDLSVQWRVTHVGGNGVVLSNNRARFYCGDPADTAVAQVMNRSLLLGYYNSIDWEARRLHDPEGELTIIARADGTVVLGEHYFLIWEDNQANPKLYHCAADGTETLLATIAGMTLDVTLRDFKWTIVNLTNGHVYHSFYLGGALITTYTNTSNLKREEGYVGFAGDVTAAATSDGINYVVIDKFKAYQQGWHNQVSAM